MSKQCPTCKGTRKSKTGQCPTCKGKGTIPDAPKKGLDRPLDEFLEDPFEDS